MQKQFVAETSKAVKSYGIPQVKLSYVADRVAEAKYGEPVCSSVAISRILRQWWDEDSLTYSETMVAMFLNRRNKVIGILPISSGSTSSCLVDYRKILTAALLCNASAVALAHNHPSGNLAPSGADDNVTKRAKAALEAVDIKLLDHVIITDEGHYSYHDEGRMF